MFDPENFKSEIFFTANENFTKKALALFEYQWENNEIYQSFCVNIGKNPKNVTSLSEIPFLPIELFKTQQVKTGSWDSEKIFLSSGTTGMERSKHHVRSVRFYHSVAQNVFESAYGNLGDFTILALLPSYLEQGQSSLISMVDHFIQNSKTGSGFVLDNDDLIDRLDTASGKKLIIGVSYALLDLAESPLRPDLSDAIIMETGGMKGRRKEMIREELHTQLKKAFKVPSIHSEYGMTELFSQAYGENGLFLFPQWCKCLLRDINDPLSYVECGKTGGINVIDLANIDTCAFIETKDLGKMRENNFFEVLGRLDNADIRGCNLLI